MLKKAFTLIILAAVGTSLYARDIKEVSVTPKEKA